MRLASRLGAVASNEPGHSLSLPGPRSHPRPGHRYGPHCHFESGQQMAVSSRPRHRFSGAANPHNTYDSGCRAELRFPPPPPRNEPVERCGYGDEDFVKNVVFPGCRGLGGWHRCSGLGEASQQGWQVAGGGVGRVPTVGRGFEDRGHIPSAGRAQ